MSLLALLQPDARGLARVREALRARHELVTCPDWPALVETVRQRPVAGCVIDLYHHSKPVSPADLRILFELRPSIAVLVYSEFSGREMDLYELGRQHVHEIIMADTEDSVRQIREATLRALTGALAGRVAAALEGHVTGLELDALLWAAEHALSRPRAADLTRALRVSRWQLARRLRRSSALTARQILVWGRLLQGVRLLSEPTVTVEGVAFRLGYSSSAAFRRALQAKVGMTPTEVVERGGVECVLRSFLERLEAARSR